MSGPTEQSERPGQTAETEETDPDAVTVCPECETETLVRSADDDELVCEDCGLVVESAALDHGQEWPAVTDDGQPRAASPLNPALDDESLTRQIGRKNADTTDNGLSMSKRAELQRLRTEQERLRTKNQTERNTQLGLTEIQRMAVALDLPRSVREVATVTYRRAVEANMLRGRTMEGVATACLYAACRIESFPRSLDELSGMSRVERHEVGRIYRRLSTELELAVEPVSPKQFVPRFVSTLDLGETVKTKAEEIIEQTAEQGLVSGKSPTGYAAAAIYTASMLCGEKRTQEEIAAVAGTTTVTIRTRYHEQLEALDGS